MARIRTVKPEFFRHEGLQELTLKNGPIIMLFFAGLWTQCDKAGRFLWRPRQLKLDILPYLKYDPEKSLEVLEASNFVRRYSVANEIYGEVVNFSKHQLIFGSESKYEAKFPNPEGFYCLENQGLPKENQNQTKDHGVKELGVRNNGVRNNYDAGASDLLKVEFEKARKAFPGAKRGLETEWGNFTRKHPKDPASIVPLLFPAIEAAKAYRAKVSRLQGAFLPDWKHFQTWINGKHWEDEFPTEVVVK